MIGANEGFVEHLAFESGEAAHGSGALGDHRPVSVTLSERSK